MHDRRHGTEGAEPRRAVIDIGAKGLGRLTRRAAHNHVAAHRLGNGVEANLLGVRPDGPERCVGDKDDVRLERSQALVVESQLLECAWRHIGYHNIGGGDQFFLNFPALWLGRVEGDTLLVPIALEEHAAGTGLIADLVVEAVLAAVDFLHPDDFGAEIAEQCRTPRARDIAAKIQNPNTVQYARH